MSRTAQIIVLASSVLAGLGLSRVLPSLPVFGLMISAGLLLICCRCPRLLILALIICGISLGWWRGSVVRKRLALYEPLYHQTVTINAVAKDDAVYGKTKQLSFTVSKVRLDDGQALPGSLQVSGFGVNAVFQGDEIAVTGKLYPGYGSYQGRISFASLQVVEHHPTLLASVRRKFVAGMQSALPEPLAPFAMGLLVGQRATLPDATKKDLQMVGLTHIIAVSGYNLTIILQASRRFLRGHSKRMATLLSLGLIVVFLLLAGASASIVRAAIVSLLSVMAAYYGRSFSPLSLLLLTAVITAFANPVYIWSDLSWYLSFLAFFGVMILSPLVQRRWSGRWHQTLIGAVALESVCAEVLSLPFVLFIFGQMSLVGLPANVLVVTLVPLAMLLGVIAGLAGMLLGAFAGWISWPATLLLNYMLDIAHLMAHLPHIYVENRPLSLAGMLLLYSLICMVMLFLWHKTKHQKSATITDIQESKDRGIVA